MKKRIMALLLGLVLFSNANVISFATDSSIYVGNMTTATQEEAREKENEALESEDETEESVGDTEETEETETPVIYHEIKIATADDLINLANNCKMDTWSVDKRVILENDISFRGREFYGIPTFGGIFDGQGHEISDISIDRGVSYSGFFGVAQKTAVIRDLKISGMVEPSGDQTFSGGIVGDNSGVLIKCHFTGVVSGKDYVGGIVGMNELSGVISGCTSEGYVHGTHFTASLTWTWRP